MRRIGWSFLCLLEGRSGTCKIAHRHGGLTSSATNAVGPAATVAPTVPAVLRFAIAVRRAWHPGGVGVLEAGDSVRVLFKGDGDQVRSSPVQPVA